MYSPSQSSGSTEYMLRQRTLKSPVHAIGIGVHSGRKVRMTLRPAEANTGIRFVRLDKPSTEIAALAQNVSDTALATSICENGVEISTVEHLMSGLWGMGIDNLLIELSGDEVPIMDGSAAPFVDLIQSVGIRELDDTKRYIRITRELTVTQGDAWVSLRPYDGFKADYTFVYDHPLYNRYPKSVEIDFDRISYGSEVAKARTFGLQEELEQAQAVNKCLGSSLENSVGIANNEIMNAEGLRYHDEFVKHKLLDSIGDLYLLGFPVIGHLSGYKSGHALNNKLARTVLRCSDAWEDVSPNSSGSPVDPVEEVIATAD